MLEEVTLTGSDTQPSARLVGIYRSSGNHEVREWHDECNLLLTLLRCHKGRIKGGQLDTTMTVYIVSPL